MFKCKFCQIDGHFEVDCRKKKTAKDEDTKTSKSLFLSKSSAPAAVDPDSEDESYEPRAYVVNVIQSEGGSHAMPDIVSDDDSLPGLIDDSDDDSLPGLIDDSDSDDDSDVTIRHLRRRLPWQSRVDP
jgi:hypothetical protein